MMKVIFNDGTVKTCSAPIEQKIFKAGIDAGWLLIFSLVCDITSDKLDEILTEDNISKLTFTFEDETVTEKTILLSGYEKISSAIIRYSEEKDKTRVEIHLTKGV